jgi:hypothetical protein
VETVRPMLPRLMIKPSAALLYETAVLAVFERLRQDLPGYTELGGAWGLISRDERVEKRLQRYALGAIYCGRQKKVF